MITHTLNRNLLLVIRLFIVIFCFLSSAFSRIGNISVEVGLCVAVYGIITFFTNYQFLIKYVALVTSAGLAIIGTFVIENSDIWLSELGTYSHNAGALSLIAGFYLLFLFTLEYMDSYLNKRNGEKRTLNIYFNQYNVINVFLKFFPILFFAITCVMCLRVLRHPAFLVNMDRFAYKEQYLQGIWGKLDNYYFYFVPILLMCWDLNKKKKLIVSIFSLYFLYLFLCGEKYGKFIVLIMFFSLYFVPTYIIKDKTVIKRLLKIIVAVFGITLVIILWQYSKYTWTTPVEHFQQRIAQQGQLWWAIYDQQAESFPNVEEIYDETSAFSENQEIYPYYGIYKIMFLTAPYNQVLSKIKTGSTYTESSAASLYYYFGTGALIVFSVLMGIWFAFIAYKYVDYINRKCMIETMIIIRLIYLGRAVLSNSAFNYYLGLDTAFTIVIWMICVLIRHSICVNKKEAVTE